MCTMCYSIDVVNSYNNLINVFTKKVRKKKMLKVTQLKSSKTERPVCNQFIIETNDYIIFQSYKTLICALDKKIDALYVFDYVNALDVSRTTSKYMYQFLDQFHFTLKCEDEKVKNSSLPYYKKLQKISNMTAQKNVFYISTKQFTDDFLKI